MKLVLQILGTVLIVFVIIFLFVIGIAVSGSSHNMASSTREAYALFPKIACVIGVIAVFCIWFPWQKWIKK